MTPSEAIRAILKADRRPLRSLAAELEITPQALDYRLSGDMKDSSLSQMAGLLGYKVMLAPKGGPVDGFETDGAQAEL